MIDFVPPGTKVLKQNVLRGFEYRVFVMYAVERIYAIISAIRERRTEWVYIKYLDTSFTHGPGSICVVELNPLKKKKKKSFLKKILLQWARG